MQECERDYEENSVGSSPGVEGAHCPIIGVVPKHLQLPNFAPPNLSQPFRYTFTTVAVSLLTIDGVTGFVMRIVQALSIVCPDQITLY